jgi:hypothetical protein
MGFPSLQLRTGLVCLGFMRSLVARQSLDYVPAAPPIYIVLREKDPLPTERHVLPIKIREEILPKPGQIFLICKRSHSSHIPPLCSQCSKREQNTTTILRWVIGWVSHRRHTWTARYKHSRLRWLHVRGCPGFSRYARPAVCFFRALREPYVRLFVPAVPSPGDASLARVRVGNPLSYSWWVWNLDYTFQIAAWSRSSFYWLMTFQGG